MDCRRQARKRGLLILGTRKIWDSSLAAIGMLWAKRQGKRQFRTYHDRVFERFWRRELDIENPASIAAVLSEVDADTTGFSSYLTGEGRIEHDTIREFAETFMTWFLSYLTRAYVELGQFNDAWRRIGEMMTAVQTTKESWWEADLHRICRGSRAQVARAGCGES